MFRGLIKKCKRKRGFTLTEVLVVVAIIAVVCAIAIPSIISIRTSLAFQQKNDYAKSIFLAAQANLTKMRAEGSLEVLQPDQIGSGYPSGSGKANIPADSEDPDKYKEYSYTYHDPSDATINPTFDRVLPVGSIESTVRDEQIIIEFNPYTGNVYAVFYSEEAHPLMSEYPKTDAEFRLPRNAEGDEDERKEMMLGYYDGSDLSKSELGILELKAEVQYTNGEEGLVTVVIPTQSDASGETVQVVTNGDYAHYIAGLDVTLTITDGKGGSIQKVIKTNTRDSETGDAGPATCSIELGDGGMTYIHVTYPIDSLVESGSFANLSAGIEDASLTSIQSETDSTGKPVFAIAPGDNVTVTADVTYVPAPTDPIVEIESGTRAGVNPMFHSLTGTAGSYTLAISNGRNLQNLNALAPSIASQVETVIFVEDTEVESGSAGTTDPTETSEPTAPAAEDGFAISWKDTVTYYNNKYGTNGQYSNTTEAPARALPCFVPINNPYLFGTASLEEDGLSEQDIKILSNNTEVTLTPATISGNGVKIYDLNIDVSGYSAPNSYYANSVSGVTPTYAFTGLFSYVNTEVKDVEIVNPIIRGSGFTASNFPATGALVGVAGTKAEVSDCGVYIDKEDADFVSAALDLSNFRGSPEQKDKYGVSGYGAVGGLVGYTEIKAAITSGDATAANATFYRCFAAVPVAGEMQGNNGYTNGVGGLAGVTYLSNFYNCYASGPVYATGASADYSSYLSFLDKPDANSIFQEFCSAASKLGSNSSLTDKQNAIKTKLDSNNVTDEYLQDIFEEYGYFINLPYNGRSSMGVGGFVGTSHGSRYSNCFSTGDVKGGASASGIGGFVGVMCYDASGLDNNGESAIQHTIFDSCYSVGRTSSGEDFSGANAWSSLTINRMGVSAFMGSYYELLAPYLAREYSSGIPAVGIPNSLASGGYYIFKDCYYLSHQSHQTSDSNTNSNNCASIASYDTLCALTGVDTGWIDAEVETIKDFDCMVFSTYGAEFFTQQSISSEYGASLGEGFETKENNDWHRFSTNTSEESSTYSPKTYAYDSDWIVENYPFPILDNMDYYGTWPRMPLDGGIAYYEEYSDDPDATTAQSGSTFGYYFDQNDTSTLKTGTNTVILSDGYAIFTPNASDTVIITAYSADGTQIATHTWYSGTAPNDSLEFEVNGVKKEYSVYWIPASFLEKCNSTSFYTSLTISVTNDDNSSASYDAHLNPNVALGHVNSSSTPDAPSKAYIRTARQLAAVGRNMENFWNINYEQQLDIDFTTYTGEIGTIAPIGKENKPFTGTYSASTTDGESLSIIGHVPANDAHTGIFGVIGAGGKVKDLTIQPQDKGDPTAPVSVSASSADSLGLLAGVNHGTIENVDVVLDKDLTLTGKTNIGILVGSMDDAVIEGSDGKETLVSAAIKNVNITVKDVTVAGTTFGGVVGKTSATNGAGVTISDATVTVNGKVSATNAAGIVGNASGLTLTKSSVTLDGTIEGSGSAAGVIGSMDTHCTVTDVTFAFADTGSAINSTGSAAGFVGTTGGKLTNCSVSGTGKISGNDKAAGFAVTAKSGTIDRCFVSPVADAEEYAGKSNTSLQIVADTDSSNNTTGNAAGFVIDNGADIKNSWALGAVSGEKTAGFALTNQESGIIDRSTTNVSMADAAANGESTVFVGTNSGEVSNCYGWATGGDLDGVTTDTSGAAKVTGTGYTSSYFGTMGQKDTVVLFDAKGTGTTSTNYILTADSALTTLGSSAWYKPGTYAAYPYTASLGQVYPYPMLRDHYGDWAIKSDAIAYGVVYYEQYKNGWGVEVVDLSGTGLVPDKDSMGTGNVEVVDAGYAVYYPAGSTPIDINNGTLGNKLDSDKYAELYKAAGINSGLYTLYEISGPANVTQDNLIATLTSTTDSTKSVTLVPYFADTINNTAQPYKIRNQKQLGNISKASSSSFTVDRSFTASGTGPVVADFSGSLTGTSGVTVTSNTTLFGSVSGKISGLTVSGSKMTGGLIGTLNGGSVSNVTVKGDFALSGTAGTVANTVTSGTMTGCTVDAEITASGSGAIIGGVVGQTNGGSFSNVNATVSISGTDFALVNTSAALNPSGLGSVGLFVGHVESGKFEDCTTSNTGSLACQFLGTIAVTRTNEKPTHYTDPGEKNYTALNSPNGVYVYAFSSDIELKNCTFDGTLQEIVAEKDFYNHTGYTKASTPAQIQAASATITYQSLMNSDLPNSNYFYLSNETYYRVSSVSVSESDNGDYTVSFTPAGDSTEFIETVTDLNSTCGNLYTLSANLDMASGKQYILIAEGSSGPDVLQATTKTVSGVQFIDDPAANDPTALYDSTMLWTANGEYLASAIDNDTQVRVAAELNADSYPQNANIPVTLTVNGSGYSYEGAQFYLYEAIPAYTYVTTSYICSPVVSTEAATTPATTVPGGDGKGNA